MPVPHDPARVQSVFSAAVEIADPTERSAYLDSACSDDPALRQRVEALLRASDEADSVIDAPPAFPPLPEVTAFRPPDATTPHVAGDTHASGDALATGDGGFGFVLGDELGRGGMGVVYRAVQRGFNRPVALKTVRDGARADPKQLIRFLAEAEAVAAVRHPHVVQVFEYGNRDGLPYLAMEFCPGKSLAKRLPDGPYAPRAAAELVGKIAAGVAAAHARGIVHRDLKPDNILFDEHDEPKVSDFGLAKQIEGADLTPDNQGMGTPAYMAPEQARAAKFVGPQADVWALGVILHECLTGTRLFTGSLQEILAKVQAAEPVAPRAVVPLVPRDLELICLKCLAKEPHERYPTAQEFAADLENFLAGRPVSARPVGPLERAYKAVKRNKVVSGALAAAVFGLVGGAAASIGFGLDARESALTAKGEQARADDRAAAATKEAARADSEKAGANAARGELQVALGDVQVALARTILAPVATGDHRNALTPSERAGFWQLAARRGTPVAASFLEEATGNPLACAQLETRAAFALHAAVGLGPDAREKADRLLLARLTDPDAPSEKRASLAVAISRWEPAHADTAARAAEELTDSLLRDSNPATLRARADGLAALACRIDPAAAANLCDRVAVALAGAVAASNYPVAQREQAAGLAAVSARLEPVRALTLLTDALPRGRPVRGRNDPAPAGPWADKEAAELVPAFLAAADRLEPGRGTAEAARAAEALINVMARIAFDPREKESAAARELSRALSAVAARMEPARAVQLISETMMRPPGQPGFVQTESAGKQLERVLSESAARLPPDAAFDALTRLTSTRGALNVQRAMAVGLAAAVGRMDPDRAAAACEPAVAGFVFALAMNPPGPGQDAVVATLAAVAGAMPRDRESAACDKVVEPVAKHMTVLTDPKSIDETRAALLAVALRSDPDRAARAVASAMDTAKSEHALGRLAEVLAAVAPGLKPDAADAALDKAARKLADRLANLGSSETIAKIKVVSPAALLDGLTHLVRRMQPARAIPILADAIARAKTAEFRTALANCLGAVAQEAPDQPAEARERAALVAAQLLADGTRTEVAGPLAAMLAALAVRMEPEKAAALFLDILTRSPSPYIRTAAARELAAGVPRLGPDKATAALDSAARTLSEALTKAAGNQSAESQLAAGLAALTGRMEPTRAAAVLTDALTRTTFPPAVTELVNGLQAASARMTPAAAAAADAATAALLADAITPTTNLFVLRNYAQLLSVVAGRLEPGKAAVLCDRAARVLTERLAKPSDAEAVAMVLEALAFVVPHASPDSTATLMLGHISASADERSVYAFAAALAKAAERMEAGKASAVCEQAAAVLLRRLDSGPKGEAALSTLAAALAKVAGRMEAEKAAAVCEPAARAVADAMNKINKKDPYRLAGLARTLVAVTERMEAAKAAAACEPAAKLLLDALAAGPDPFPVQEVVPGVAAVAARLGRDRGAAVCERAARLITDAMTQTTESGRLTALSDGLVRLEPGMGPSRAAAARGRAARAVADAMLKGQSAPDKVAELVAATASRMDPPDAIEFLTDVVARATEQAAQPIASIGIMTDAVARASDPTARRILAQALSAAVERAGPERAAYALIDLTAADPADVRGRVRLLSEHTNVAGHDRARVVHAAALTAGTAVGPSGTLPALAVLPLQAAARRNLLPPQALADLLKHPFCVGDARRVVLDALEITYGRRFTDHWAFVAYARDSTLPLDLHTPLKAPQPKP